MIFWECIVAVCIDCHCVLVIMANTAIPTSHYQSSDVKTLLEGCSEKKNCNEATDVQL